MARVAMFFSLAAAATASRQFLTPDTGATVADEVVIHGSNGDTTLGGDDLVAGKCIDHIDASSFTVKGCNFAIKAHLLTECGAYGKYSHQIGQCDCGSSAPDQQTLQSGYTEKFDWTATSIEIIKC